VNLLELDIGNKNPKYQNSNLNKVSFGSNKMLQRVNVENCGGLKEDLNLGSCPNIIEINAKGTQIKNIILPPKGIIETLLLPNTVSTLILNN
jgi:hypothetical protein